MSRALLKTLFNAVDPNLATSLFVEDKLLNIDISSCFLEIDFLKLAVLLIWGYFWQILSSNFCFCHLSTYKPFYYKYFKSTHFQNPYAVYLSKIFCGPPKRPFMDCGSPWITSWELLL